MNKKEAEKRATTPFNPKPLSFKRDRKMGLQQTTPPIDWASLDEAQRATQWRHCKHALWAQERDGVVKEDDVAMYLGKYMETIGKTKEQIANAKRADYIPYSLTCACYLLVMGAKPNEDTYSWVGNKIDELIASGEASKLREKPAIVEDKPEPTRSPDERALDEQHDLIAELCAMEDEILNSKNIPGFLNWLRHRNAPRGVAQVVADKFSKHRQEIVDAMEKKDPQLVEAYSKFKRNDFKQFIAWYDKLIEDCDSYKRLKQSTQKIRVVKEKPPIKMVGKLKYKPYDEDLKLQSIRPEGIIKAQQVWFYNTKTRKFGVYNALDSKGISVKGTTLLNWDPATSVSKTLRKPVEQLKTFAESNKVQTRKLLETIKATEIKLNGRMSKDILLLRVY
jgi:hypothetical protein